VIGLHRAYCTYFTFKLYRVCFVHMRFWGLSVRQYPIELHRKWSESIHTTNNNNYHFMAIIQVKVCISWLSQHVQLRTGGFCWCKVLLPACPCLWQPVHSFRSVRRRCSSPQQCYLHCLCTVFIQYLWIWKQEFFRLGFFCNNWLINQLRFI